MKYRDKHILLIAPKFYGYEERIVKALKDEGFIVSFEYIYKLSRAGRILSKVFHSHFVEKENSYYSGIIKKYSNYGFDYILVVDGKGLSVVFLNELLSNHSESKSVYYSWDSLQYFDYLAWLKIFDKVYTFDYKDSAQFGIEYLPLFYTPEFDAVAKSKSPKDIDLLFIATYKENRLCFINSITNKYKSSFNIKVVLYLSIYRYLVDIFKGKKIRFKDVVFRPLPFNKYLDLLSRTKVVVDYTPATQTGLPMRIPEAVGAKKKIITNNENIRNEFDSRYNILVYRGNEDIASFVLASMNELREREDYSVSNWIMRLFK